MPIESAFLSAILADPTDDTSRLEFSDWLEEHGQVERAELIRWQIETGVPFWRDPKAARWRNKPKRGVRWFPSQCWKALNSFLSEPVPGIFVVSRGFISTITTTAADWEKHGPALCAAAPVERVEIIDMPLFQSGGNDTFFVGGLGRFPKEYWCELDGLPSRSDALAALSAAAIAWASLPTA